MGQAWVYFDFIFMFLLNYLYQVRANDGLPNREARNFREGFFPSFFREPIYSNQSGELSLRFDFCFWKLSFDKIEL